MASQSHKQSASWVFDDTCYQLLNIFQLYFKNMINSVYKLWKNLQKGPKSNGIKNQTTMWITFIPYLLIDHILSNIFFFKVTFHIYYKSWNKKSISNEYLNIDFNSEIDSRLVITCYWQKLIGSLQSNLKASYQLKYWLTKYQLRIEANAKRIKYQLRIEANAKRIKKRTIKTNKLTTYLMLWVY